MPHKLFLFDFNDMLLDYQKSEQLSFAQALEDVGFFADSSEVFAQFQAINFALWRRFEAGAISREHLKSDGGGKRFWPMVWRWTLNARASATLNPLPTAQCS